MPVLYPPREGGNGGNRGPAQGAGPAIRSGTPARGRAAGGRSRVRDAFPDEPRPRPVSVRRRTRRAATRARTGSPAADSTRGGVVPQQTGNQTPNTPDVSETALREMKVDELREAARDEGVAGTSGMRKEELVHAVAEAASGEADGGDVGAGPDGGRLRTGSETSKSLKYSQNVTSPDDDPERPGRSLATTNHQVIKEWAEQRGGTPATVEGTEHGDHLGVLRFA